MENEKEELTLEEFDQLLEAEQGNAVLFYSCLKPLKIKRRRNHVSGHVTLEDMLSSEKQERKILESNDQCIMYKEKPDLEVIDFVSDPIETVDGLRSILKKKKTFITESGQDDSRPKNTKKQVTFNLKENSYLKASESIDIISDPTEIQGSLKSILKKQVTDEDSGIQDNFRLIQNKKNVSFDFDSEPSETQDDFLSISVNFDIRPESAETKKKVTFDTKFELIYIQQDLDTINTFDIEPADFQQDSFDDDVSF